MPDYRVYRLSRDGHITRGDYVAAADDEDAIRAVRGQASASDCEIWLANRKVALVPAGGGEPIKRE